MNSPGKRMSTLAARNFSAVLESDQWLTVSLVYCAFIINLYRSVIPGKSATPSDISLDILNGNRHFLFPAVIARWLPERKTSPIMGHPYTGIPDIDQPISLPRRPL